MSNAREKRHTSGRGTGGTISREECLRAMQSAKWSHSADYCLDAPDRIPAGSVKSFGGVLPLIATIKREQEAA